MKKMVSLILAILMLMSISLAGAEDALSILNPAGTLPVVSAPYTLTVGVAERSNVTDIENSYVTKWIEERTGIDIEFVFFPETDTEAKLDLLVASGEELPDILAVGMWNSIRRQNYGESGVLIPLNELFEKYGAPFYARCEEAGLNGDDILARVTSPDGNIYGAPFYDYYIGNILPNRMWINQSWLDKLGLAMPQTSEDLLNVLRAFRDQDPNGNGIADEIPMSGASSNALLMFLQNMFIYADGNENWYLPLSETNGQLEVCYDKEAYRDFLRYVKQLYDEKLIDPQIFSYTDAQYNTLMSADPSLVGVSQYWAYTPMLGHTDKWVVLPALEGPTGLRQASSAVPPCNAQMAITKDCEHPEIAFAFMTFQYIDKWDRITYRWGEEGVDWERAPEDALSAYEDIGIPADMILHNDIWYTVQNTIWNGACEFPAIVTGDQQNSAITSTETCEYQYALQYMGNVPYYIPFEDQVDDIIYTVDEYNEWNDVRSSVSSYMSECRALFMTGEMDIEKDWDAYLEELEAMGYKELTAMDQAAYERTYGVWTAAE